jgi:peptide/nickel transport system permease protein
VAEALRIRRTSLPEPLWRIRVRLAWRGFVAGWRLFKENPIGLIGLGIILFYGLLALAHPILMATLWDPRTYDPITGYDAAVLTHPAPPSSRHLLGTDPIGRDVLSQLMYSARWEFGLGMLASVISVTVATLVGAACAYYGRVIDMVFMRLADVISMLPFIAVLVVLSALFDFQLLHLAIVYGILVGFGGQTIVIKSQALTVKVKPYIDAARVAGGSNAHIIFTHMLPNLMPLAFLYMMFTVTGAVFIEAALSFFGLLNIRMSWGIMINTAQASGYLLAGPGYLHLMVPAGISITLFCSAFYLVGRALDEVVNPRLRKR